LKYFDAEYWSNLRENVLNFRLGELNEYAYLVDIVGKLGKVNGPFVNQFYRDLHKRSISVYRRALLFVE
jgi:hypothetical protein